MIDSLGGVLGLDNIFKLELSSVDVAGGCRNCLRVGVVRWEWLAGQLCKIDLMGSSISVKF